MGIVAGRVLDSEASAMASEPAPKSGKRQITRNRTSYSCQACRRRKVKCDKKQPVCSGCERSNDVCVYGKVETPFQEQATAQSASATKRRISFLDDEQQGAPLERSFGAPKQVVLNGLEDHLNRLTSMVENLRREHVNGPKPPPTPNSLSQNNSEADSQSQREHSDSPSSNGEAVTRRSRDLNASLSELDISHHHTNYLHSGRERFWSHMTDELDQLRYLINGSRSLPVEQQLTSAMGLEHTDCNRPRDKPHPTAVIDDPIDMHQFQPSVPHDVAGDCRSCSIRSGDKSTLLMPRRLKKLDLNATRVNITSNLPTEAQSNVLFRSWMTSVYPIMPVLPMRLMLKRYQRFWEWSNNMTTGLNAETETPDMYIMPLLYAVWYTGALSLSLKTFQRLFPGRTRAEVCANYHDQCIRLLTMVSFPNTNHIWLLASFVMLQSAPCGEEEPLQNSDYVNLMVRLAQAQGLHREPTLAELHPFDAEFRRRVWWQILQLDTSLAVSSGFSTCTSEETSDVRPISPSKEMFIGSDEEIALLHPNNNGAKPIEPVDDPFGPSRSIASVGALVARTYSTIAIASRKLVAMHMRTRPVNKEDLREMNEVITNVEAEVREVINTIPTKGVPEMGFTPDESRPGMPVDFDPMLELPPTDQEVTFWTGILTDDLPMPLARFHRQRLAAFHRWARIYLSMMCDKMHCIAYAPFLKNLKSTLWAGGRQCALHHTSAYLRKFISLARDPSLEPFRWTWPGTAQPMHAAIILLVDLYERPQSIEAARSRALIDEVFALSAPEFGIVGTPNSVSAQRPFREGGGDAWEMLRNLRASAWRKAGIDPNVLWTQDQQLQVGIARNLTMEQKVAQSLREDSLYEESAPGENNEKVIRRAINDLHSELNNTIPQSAPTNGISQAEGTAKRLIRLPDQQLMPFPLLTQVITQSSSQAQVQGAAAHIDAIRYTDEAPEEWQEAELESAQNPTIQPSVSADVSQAYWQSAEALPSVSSRVAQSYTDAINQAQPVVQPFGTPQLVVDDPSDQMDFAFDWDAWDAVFNQYSGFTDSVDMDLSGLEAHDAPLQQERL